MRTLRPNPIPKKRRGCPPQPAPPKPLTDVQLLIAAVNRVAAALEAPPKSFPHFNYSIQVVPKARN